MNVVNGYQGPHEEKKDHEVIPAFLHDGDIHDAQGKGGSHNAVQPVVSAGDAAQVPDEGVNHHAEGQGEHGEVDFRMAHAKKADNKRHDVGQQNSGQYPQHGVGGDMNRGQGEPIGSTGIKSGVAE